MGSCTQNIFIALAFVALAAEGVRISKKQWREEPGKGDETRWCPLPAARAICESMQMDGTTSRENADKINSVTAGAACEPEDVTSLCSGLSKAETEFVHQLVSDLSADDADTRQSAADAIVKISRETISKQEAFVYAGAIEPLVSMLNSLNEHELAAGVIRELAAPKNPYSQIQWGMASQAVINPLVEMLNGPQSAARKIAAAAIRNLAYKNYDENKERIALAAIDSLVRLLGSESTSDEREEAAGAIRNLAHASPSNRKAMAGAIEVLVKVQKAAPIGSKERGEATGALWNLAWRNTANKDAITDAGGDLVKP